MQTRNTDNTEAGIEPPTPEVRGRFVRHQATPVKYAFLNISHLFVYFICPCTTANNVNQKLFRLIFFYL